MTARALDLAIAATIALCSGAEETCAERAEELAKLQASRLFLS
jgi:hypothetical protein